MNVPHTKQEAIDSLRSGCEKSLSRLNELIDIHFQLDPVDRPIDPSDDDIVYRLRKVLLHVKSVSEWHLDTEVMHVLAPELRAAQEQIEKIWKSTRTTQLKDFAPGLASELYDSGAGTSLPMVGKILSTYIHPSPQRLLLAGEHGGLATVDEVRYFAQLFICVTAIVVRYAVCLALLAQATNGPMVETIVSVLCNATEEFNKLSPADHLRFAERHDTRAASGGD